MTLFKSSNHYGLALCLCAATAISHTFAQTSSTWQASELRLWDIADNWDAGVPMSAGDEAIFGPDFPTADSEIIVGDANTTVGTITYNNPYLLSLYVNTFTFDGNGSAASIDIQNGDMYFITGSLILASDLDLTVAPGSTARFDAASYVDATLGGTGSLNIQGGGVVVLGTGNTYSGQTNITNTTLLIAADDSLGSSTGVDADGTIINTDGILKLANNAIRLPDEKITLNGGAITGDNWTLDSTISVSTGRFEGGVWILKGPISVDDTVTFGGGGGNIGRVLGTVSGTGGIHVDAVGRTVLLGNVNTYEGTTVVSNGTLAITNASTLGTTSGTSADATTVNAGGELRLAANMTLSDELIILNGGTLGTLGNVAPGFNNPIISNGGVIDGDKWSINDTLTLDGDLTIYSGTDGNISAQVSGTGSLIFESGETNVTGTNTYTGQTLIKNGATVITSNPYAFGTGSGTDADATIVYSGGSLGIYGGSSNGFVSEKIILDGGTILGGETDGPVELRSDSTINQTELNGLLSGVGGLIIDNDGLYSTELNHANTYMGITRLKQGALSVSDPLGLGDASGGTIINGGDAYLMVSTQEPILVDGGSLHLLASDYYGPVEIDFGVLENYNSNNNATSLTIHEPVQLVGGEASLRGGQTITLAQGTTGNGDLVFSSYPTNAQFMVDAPLAHQGDVTIKRGEVNINTAFELDGTWVLDRSPTSTSYAAGELQVNVDLTGRLDMIGGTLKTENGSTFTSLDTTLDVRGGQININLAGVTQITKNSFQNAWFETIGADNDADIDVLRGQLTLSGADAAGSIIGRTTVASKHATLVLDSGNTFNEMIFLDNATGRAFDGGLIAEAVTLTAPLHTGDGLSIINAPGQFVLEGTLTGADLYLIGDSDETDGGFVMTAPDNALTGRLNIGSKTPVATVLRDNGRLISAHRIEIEHGGLLQLNNRNGTNLPDRIDDAIPVLLRGGELQLLASDNEPTSERLGRIEASIGLSTISIGGGGADKQALLTIGEFARQPGTHVNFKGQFADPDSPTPGNAAIMIDTAPTLTNGIIGGWAIADESNFATYTTHGIAPYTDYETDFDAADQAANVSLDAQPTMTADKTINSLRLGYHGSLDLNGHTLNIISGGILQLPFDTTIDNGTLTAGGDAPGELLIYNDNGTTHISADITDNGSASVDLVLASRVTYLYGDNTYSGDTYVTYGITRLFTDTALPEGTNITIADASLTSEYESTTTKSVGTVYLQSGGLYVPNLDAERYTIEGGSLSGIVGDGPVLKTTPGRAKLGFNTQYTGDVTIEMGVLRVGNYGGSDTNLRSGRFIVQPNGELEIIDRHTDVGSDVLLDGGTITFIGGGNPTPTLSGPLFVNADSCVHINGNGTISGQISGTHKLSIWDLNTNNGAANIYLSGDNSNFTGDIDMNSGRLIAQSEHALGLGVTTVSDLAVLWANTALVRGNIILNGGRLGTLELHNKVNPASFADLITVAADSYIEKENNIAMLGGLRLNDNTKLTKIDSGNLFIDCDLIVGNNTTLATHQGHTYVSGTITAAAPVSSLQLIGLDKTTLEASIVVDAGRTLTITVDATPIDLNITGGQHTVSGNGILGNNLTLDDAATIAPGNSPGKLTIDGDYTQLLTAVMQIELAGNTADLYDQLAITGNFTPGGTFELILLDNFIPTVGDTFDIIEFYTLTPNSSFDQLILPDLPNGRAWDTTNLLTTGQIQVVPEPATALLLLPGLFMRRRTH